MKLTGSMLASIDMIAQDRTKIEIGIENEEAPKAYNHMVGETVPQRPFLGLTAKDLEQVKAEFKKEIKPVTVADIFQQNDLARLANIVGSRRNAGFEE